jgi:hypothetical protein
MLSRRTSLRGELMRESEKGAGGRNGAGEKGGGREREGESEKKRETRGGEGEER